MERIVPKLRTLILHFIVCQLNMQDPPGFPSILADNNYVIEGGMVDIMAMESGSDPKAFGKGKNPSSLPSAMGK